MKKKIGFESKDSNHNQNSTKQLRIAATTVATVHICMSE
jgi:hypothetical protein